MATNLTIADQTATGQTTGETVLEFLTETITVRELIRARVYQEVDDYNRHQPERFRGLVQPADMEQKLNNPREPKPRRHIDFKSQFAVACDAFARNGFFVLVEDQQVEDLDEVITLRPGTKVSFVKLTPLVGG